MRTNRFVSRLGLVALTAVALGACSTDRVPSAPVSVPATARTTIVTVQAQPTVAPWTVTGVRRAQPLSADVTAEQVIGPRGGRLELAAAGFTLDVPAGAVAAPTAFRVTALAGDLLAYEFGPSGSTFAVPLVATQDLRATNVSRLPKRASLRIGYFVSPTDVDAVAGTATVAQELTGTVLPNGRSASFPVPHFSGWIIHWRSGDDSGETETP